MMVGPVEFGSVRPCDECGEWYSWENPDAELRVCYLCRRRNEPW